MKTNETLVCRVCGGEGKLSTGMVNYHNIQTTDLKKEFEDKLITCIKCTKCGHSWVPKEFSLETYQLIRELALEWWNKLTTLGKGGKYHFSDRYYPNRGWNNLTGREIEEIWRKETQSNFSAVDRDEDRSAAWGFGTGKPNQKQFKQFNAELHVKHLSKFSLRDRYNAVAAGLLTLHLTMDEIDVIVKVLKQSEQRLSKSTV